MSEICSTRWLMVLLDDDGDMCDMSPEDHAIGMVIPDGFRPQESRPTPVHNSLVEYRLLSI